MPVELVVFYGQTRHLEKNRFSCDRDYVNKGWQQMDKVIVNTAKEVYSISICSHLQMTMLMMMVMMMMMMMMMTTMIVMMMQNPFSLHIISR